jgi:Ca2+:H+ antiporter
MVSYSADGVVAIVYFLQSTVQRVFGYGEPSEVPSELAKARSIDLSIQFTLFWMPFIILLAWWTNSALSLLFGD